MSFVDVLAKSLKLDADYIKKVIEKSDFSYKVFYIPKLSGGKRKIYQPSAELKTLQYWLVYNVFSKFNISSSACAYCHGKSILDAARAHLCSDYILHVDIKNFFESITKDHLNALLKNSTIDSDVKKVNLHDEDTIYNISCICLYKNHLTIGAVSSPIISNLIFYDLDLIIEEYCRKKEYIYTRYADDTYISSKEFIPKDVIEDIGEMLLKKGFMLNKRKTKFMSKSRRQIITGITLTTNRKLSIGSDRKREIKKLLYKALRDLSNISYDERLRIKGYLSFIKSVDPCYCNRLVNKYANYGDIKQLL